MISVLFITQARKVRWASTLANLSTVANAMGNDELPLVRALPPRVLDQLGQGGFVRLGQVRGRLRLQPGIEIGKVAGEIAAR